MDDSRKIDLSTLYNLKHDVRKPMLARRRADLILTRIKKQLIDKDLVKLRVRMIRAKHANDITEAEKLAELIHRHVWQKYGYWI